MRDLHDKVIVITGASSGIGAATALACAEAGMAVVLGARRIAPLQQLAAGIEQRGGRAVAQACDVRRDDEVQALLDAAWQTFGRLDAAVANAGYGRLAAVEHTTDEQHRDIFETNYFGTVRLVRAALPLLRETLGGLRHLLITASIVSEIGLPYYGPYAATKAAQDGLASALRAEVAHEGIAVTTVHPVGTRTAFFDVAEQLGRAKAGSSNTPGWMMQSPARVGRCVVKALRRPKPEVWPMTAARFGAALATAFPRLTARAMRKQAKKMRG